MSRTRSIHRDICIRDVQRDYEIREVFLGRCRETHGSVMLLSIIFYEMQIYKLIDTQMRRISFKQHHDAVCCYFINAIRPTVEEEKQHRSRRDVSLLVLVID